MEKIIESVPNFSIGKKAENADIIVKAIKSVGDSIILADYSFDLDHGRLVVTIFGEGDNLIRALYEGVKAAIAKIDINEHDGIHPYIGVVDVIPIIPIKRATFNDCVKIRNDLSLKIANDFNIPIYIYGKIAKRPERNKLSSIRKGGVKELSKRMSLKEWKPDFGPSSLHPTAGAIAIGARDILIAFNVNLKSGTKEDAVEIASKIREKNKGLKGVRAIGLFLESKKKPQVSVNIVDYKSSSIKKVFDTIKNAAEEKGIDILESEIIGLIPKDAMFQNMIEYLKLKNWDESKVIENYL